MSQTLVIIRCPLDSMEGMLLWVWGIKSWISVNYKAVAGPAMAFPGEGAVRFEELLFPCQEVNNDHLLVQQSRGKRELHALKMQYYIYYIAITLFHYV